MKILMTGITGFIGQRFWPQIREGDEVFAVCRKPVTGLPGNFTAIQADLNGPEDLFDQLRVIRPDTCVHLAWEGIPDYGPEVSRRNVEQASKLWRYLVDECGCSKIVATGSCWEYGRSFGACREDEAASADSHFAQAKHALLELGRQLAAGNRISFVWARIFYAYGPGQREASLIPMMAEALRRNERPVIKTPHNANDYIYVDDIAKALGQMVYRKIPTGIYNLGMGKTVPVWQMCEYLEKAMGFQPDWSKSLRLSAIKATADFCADTAKSAAVLGWQAMTSLEEGIGRYMRTEIRL